MSPPTARLAAAPSSVSPGSPTDGELDCHRENAAGPGDFSPKGWLLIAKETVRWTLKHRAPAAAASAAFYAFLAFVPAVACFGATFGFFAGPDALQRQLDTFGDLVPKSVLELVRGEAVRFSRGPRDELLFSAALFAVGSLLSATSSLRCLMEGLNVAYRVHDHRHCVRRRLLAVALAAGVGLALAADVALVIRSGDFLSREPDVLWPTLRLIGRWVSLYAIAVVGLALLYRYGPDRRRARWRWVTPGSMVAGTVVLLTSSGMSIYLAQFANYERTYGGLGSVLGLAVWLWATMIVVLGGAELNWAMECATTAITDISGRDKPIGAPLAEDPVAR